MRIILYIFYLYILAFYNTILGDMISIYGVTIDLAGLLVILIAIYRGETTALWFAIGTAVITSTQRLDLMPWEMFSLCAVAVTAKQIGTRINLDSIPSRLIIIISLLLVHNIVITLAISSDEFVYVLYRYMLPGAGYTLLLGWLLLLIGDGLISVRKVKVLS